PERPERSGSCSWQLSVYLGAIQIDAVAAKEAPRAVWSRPSARRLTTNAVSGGPLYTEGLRNGTRLAGASALMRTRWQWASKQRVRRECKSSTQGCTPG